MLSLLRPCLLLLFLLSSPGQASNLAFSVVGLEGELEHNVLAWLGAPPDTVQERLNFLASARDRVERALQALGYYRPVIDLQVERTGPVWQLAITVKPGEPVRIRNISIQVLGPAADDEAFDRLTDDVGFAMLPTPFANARWGHPYHFKRSGSDRIRVLGPTIRTRNSAVIRNSSESG